MEQRQNLAFQNHEFSDLIATPSMRARSRRRITP